MDQPLMSFTSHIAGKNAHVHIYDHRVEWSRTGGMTAGKAGAAVLTAGLSMAAKSGRPSSGGGTEMIPIRSLTSVSTEKDGLRFWKVKLMAPGNNIDMRVTKDEAEQIKQTIQRLMLT